jgi:hypothetical protein
MRVNETIEAIEVFRPTRLTLIWPFIKLVLIVTPLVLVMMFGIGNMPQGLQQTIYDIGGANFYSLLQETFPLRSWIARPVVIVLGLLAAVGFLRAVIILFTTQLQVFDDKLVWRKGFISRDIVTVALREITGVKLSQSIISRIFNYGTLAIETRGIEQVTAYNLASVTSAQDLITSLKSGSERSL